MLLQPTSPLRRAEHVDACVRLLLESGADAVVSVVEVPHRFRPDSLMDVVDGRVVARGQRAARGRRRSCVYARNGPAVLARRADRIGDDLYGGDVRPFVMDARDSLDVDDAVRPRARGAAVGSTAMTSLNRETGRDRYFAEKERELDALLDPETGRVAERYARHVPCPTCGGESHTHLFEKRGYTIVRCDECSLVFSNPQVIADVVLDEYREGGSNDLWVDVLTSPRQLELDRAKFAEILDELEPYRGEGSLLDVGTSIGLFLHQAAERGWHGLGTEFGRRALAYARDELGVEAVDTPIEELDGEYDVVTVLSVLEHVNEPRGFLREVAAAAQARRRDVPDRPERRQPRDARPARAGRDVRRPEPPPLLLPADASRPARA